MNDRLPRRNVIVQRWAAALVLLLVVPLAIGFNARMITIRQMHQDEARLKRAVEAEKARQADLQAQLDYVTSDRYVEQWARVDARMTQPGEVAVIPVAPGAAQSGSLLPVSVHAHTSILDEWWAVFFDETASVP